MTPEAIVEFEDMKTVLASLAVLQQFRYDRKTIVYTDVGRTGRYGGRRIRRQMGKRMCP